MSQKKWCRCGHHRATHWGPNANCEAYRCHHAGENSLGIRLYKIQNCKCPAFAASSFSKWHIFLHGTEEQGRYFS